MAANLVVQEMANISSSKEVGDVSGPGLNFTVFKPEPANESEHVVGISLFGDLEMPTLEDEDSIKHSINSTITALSVLLLFEVMLGLGMNIYLSFYKKIQNIFFYSF